MLSPPSRGSQRPSAGVPWAEVMRRVPSPRKTYSSPLHAGRAGDLPDPVGERWQRGPRLAGPGPDPNHLHDRTAHVDPAHVVPAPEVGLDPEPVLAEVEGDSATPFRLFSRIGPAEGQDGIAALGVT